VWAENLDAENSKMLYFEKPNLEDEYDLLAFTQPHELHKWLTGLRIKALMQFTGLHDKNGREIWEGDIVLYRGITIHHKYKETEGIVKYSDDAASFGVYNEKGGGLSFPFFGLNGIEDYEVIGNVHQNPDLLGVTHLAQ
jgi:uncharacterized phage protein (TIGR01671 family)